MNPQVYPRTLKDSAELIARISSGEYTVHGGVVRISKGYPGAGQVVAHLQMPSDGIDLSDQFSELKEAMSKSEGALSTLKALQIANLALSGLNLAVSVAGFAIVCKKLNGISDQLKLQSEQLGEIKNLLAEIKALDEIRDDAKFRAVLKTVKDYAESGNISALEGQKGVLDECYELNRMILERVVLKPGVSLLETVRPLQERLIYLGMALAFVNSKVCSEKKGAESLCELTSDLARISQQVFDTIAENQAWVEGLSKADSNSIIRCLEYRKDVEPAIEYQRDMLLVANGNPDFRALLNENISEARFLVYQD